MKITTPSGLKHAHQTFNPDSSFFSRDSMKFFGDRMSNYAVRQPVPVQVGYHGETVLAYELVRKSPVKNGLQASAWFHHYTLARVHPIH